MVKLIAHEITEAAKVPQNLINALSSMINFSQFVLRIGFPVWDYRSKDGRNFFQ